LSLGVDKSDLATTCVAVLETLAAVVTVDDEESIAAAVVMLESALKQTHLELMEKELTVSG
jgi:hypothetical protein